MSPFFPFPEDLPKQLEKKYESLSCLIFLLQEISLNQLIKDVFLYIKFLKELGQNFKSIFLWMYFGCIIFLYYHCFNNFFFLCSILLYYPPFFYLLLRMTHASFNLNFKFHDLPNHAECFDGIGLHYRGFKATTASGRTCKRWAISPLFWV